MEPNASSSTLEVFWNLAGYGQRQSGILLKEGIGELKRILELLAGLDVFGSGWNFFNSGKKTSTCCL